MRQCSEMPSPEEAEKYLRQLKETGVMNILSNELPVAEEAFRFQDYMPPFLTPKEVEEFRQFRKLLKEAGQYASNIDYVAAKKKGIPTANTLYPQRLFCAHDKRILRERAERERRYKTGFLNPPAACSVPPIKLYELGERLLVNCSGNDCIRYRDIFQMCYEADIQLSRLIGWTRRVVERELNKQYRELEKMYQFSEEIRDYRNCME